MSTDCQIVDWKNNYVYVDVDVPNLQISFKPTINQIESTEGWTQVKRKIRSLYKIKTHGKYQKSPFNNVCQLD